MRKILLFFLTMYCISVHGQILQTESYTVMPVVSGGSSSSIVVASTDTKMTAGNATHTLTSVPVGALLVVTIAGETSGNDAIISNNAGLTFVKVGDAQAANSGDAEIWTATFTAGGNITIQAQITTGRQSSTVWTLTGQVGTGTAVTAVSQTAASRTITTTLVNSIIICVTSDFAATSGARTLRDAATSIIDDLQAGAYRGYHYWKQTTTVTIYTEGISAPVSGSNSCGTVAMEFK